MSNNNHTFENQNRQSMREMFDQISNQSSIMKATVNERRSGKSPGGMASTGKRSKQSDFEADFDGEPRAMDQQRGPDPNEFSGIMSSPGLCANDSYMEKQDDVIHNFMNNLKRKIETNSSDRKPNHL